MKSNPTLTAQQNKPEEKTLSAARLNYIDEVKIPRSNSKDDRNPLEITLPSLKIKNSPGLNKIHQVDKFTSKGDLKISLMKHKPEPKLSAEGEISTTQGNLKTSLMKDNLRSTPYNQTPDEKFSSNKHQIHLCKIRETASNMVWETYQMEDDPKVLQDDKLISDDDPKINLESNKIFPDKILQVNIPEKKLPSETPTDEENSTKIKDTPELNNGEKFSTTGRSLQTLRIKNTPGSSKGLQVGKPSGRDEPIPTTNLETSQNPNPQIMSRIKLNPGLNKILQVEESPIPTKENSESRSLRKSVNQTKQGKEWMSINLQREKLITRNKINLRPGRIKRPG